MPSIVIGCARRRQGRAQHNRLSPRARDVEGDCIRGPRSTDLRLLLGMSRENANVPLAISIASRSESVASGLFSSAAVFTVSVASNRRNSSARTAVPPR